MPTIIVKTIGAGKDYATIQAWYNACPDLVALDQIWQGQLYKEGAGANGEWTVNGIVLTASAKTTSATQYIELMPAAGQGLSSANPLRYVPANGVAIRSTDIYSPSIHVSGPVHLRLNGLQIKHNDNNGIFKSDTSGSLGVQNCFVESGGVGTGFKAVQLTTASDFVVNSVIKSAGQGVYVGGSGSQRIVNCSLVGAGTAGTFAVRNEYSLSCVVSSCAMFGFPATAESVAQVSGTNNATDLSSVGWGTGNKVSLTAANAFENVTTGSEDYRAKNDGPLPKSAVRQLSDTNDLDIFLAARSPTVPTIGAMERPGVADTAPDAPTDQTFSAVTESTITQTAVPAVTGGAATGYKFERRLPPAAFAQVANQASPTFAHTGLTGASGYEFRVRAYNAIGDSAYSTTETQWTDNPSTGGGGSLSGTPGVSSIVPFAPRVGQAVTITLYDNLGLPIAGASGTAGAQSIGPSNAQGVITWGPNLAGNITVTVGTFTQVVTVLPAAVETRDMEDSSLQSQSYVNGLFKATITFTGGLTGLVRVRAEYGGVSQEKIFGPGASVPIEWRLGVTTQQVKFILYGLVP